MSEIVEVDERLIPQLKLLGAIKQGEDGVYEMSPALEEFVREWIREQLEEKRGGVGYPDP